MTEITGSLRGVRREVTTMVVYVSVVLMGDVATIPSDDLDEGPAVAAVIWATALGLAVAHWFAFSVAAHLFRGEGIQRIDWIEGGAEAAAAVLVALVATVPLLLLDGTGAAAASLIALAAVVTTVAYIASRIGGLSRRRAVLRGAITMALALVVAAVKISIGH